MSTPAHEPLLTANWRRTTRVFLTFFALLLFLVVAIAGLFTQPGQAADQLVLDVAMRGRSSVGWLTHALTRSVTLMTVAASAILTMLIAAIRGRFALAARAGVMVVGANLMTQALKEFLIRRPYLGIGFDLPNSFPSGHATVLLSLALALVVVVPRGARTIVAAIASVAVGAAIVVIIMSGWHRPSDVIGAILVSFMWAMALAPQEDPSPARDPLNTGSIVASVVTIIGLVVAGILGWDRLQIMINEVGQGAPTETVMANHAALSVAFTSGVCLGLVALTMLSIHLVVYLQTGRNRG
ncbi:MAG: phosphatase PAP2 family protein [Actinomycetaceae bacterium]|nr:phosphatase PAP2 family protein [Actinomycetaceae bacterium]